MTVKHSAIILGAGGHSRVVSDTLIRLGFSIAAHIDPKNDIKVPSGAAVWPNERGLKDFKGNFDLFNGVGSIDLQTLIARKNLFLRLKNQGFKFANLVDPTATLANNVSLGEGIQILMGCRIQVGTSIGANVLVNTGATIDHDCNIGDHTHIAPGVTISGGVTVGEGVHIGTSAVIIQGCRIGSGSVIAAGAVVTGDVVENSVVYGIPARSRP
jgi:sugar O-acyltransferase (sialic acid O-acetyltransferase NeuD family)